MPRKKIIGTGQKEKIKTSVASTEAAEYMQVVPGLIVLNRTISTLTEQDAFLASCDKSRQYALLLNPTFANSEN